MQRDSDTYCDEPEDEEEFEAWRAGFAAGELAQETAQLLAENSFMKVGTHRSRRGMRIAGADKRE